VDVKYSGYLTSRKIPSFLSDRTDLTGDEILQNFISESKDSNPEEVTHAVEIYVSNFRINF
jgi:hypothetical protein